MLSGGGTKQAKPASLSVSLRLPPSERAFRIAVILRVLTCYKVFLVIVTPFWITVLCFVCLLYWIKYFLVFPGTICG